MKDVEKERLKKRLFPETVNKGEVEKKCLPVLSSFAGKGKVGFATRRLAVFATAFVCVFVILTILLGVFLPKAFTLPWQKPGDEDENGNDNPDVLWGDIFYASMDYLDMIAEFDETEQAESYLSDTSFNGEIIKNEAEVLNTTAYGEDGEPSVLMQKLLRETPDGETRGALFVVDDPMVNAVLSYLKLLLTYEDVQGVPVYSEDSESEGVYSSLFFFEREGYYYVFGLSGAQPPDKDYFVGTIISD